MKILATRNVPSKKTSDRYFVNTNNVKTELITDLEKAITGINFFMAIPVVPQAQPKPDTAQWKIQITHGNKVHVVSFFEDGSPQTASWQKLVGKIKRCASN